MDYYAEPPPPEQGRSLPPWLSMAGIAAVVFVIVVGAIVLYVVLSGITDKHRVSTADALGESGTYRANAHQGRDDLVPVTATIDGREYYVAASLGEKEKAANKLAEIHRRTQFLLQTIDARLDQNRRISIMRGCFQ